MEIVQTHKFDKEASKAQKPGWWTRIKLDASETPIDKYSRFKSIKRHFWGVSRAIRRLYKLGECLVCARVDFSRYKCDRTIAFNIGGASAFAWTPEMDTVRCIQHLSGWFVLFSLMTRQSHSIETGRVMGVHFSRFIPLLPRCLRHLLQSGFFSYS